MPRIGLSLLLLWQLSVTNATTAGTTAEQQSMIYQYTGYGDLTLHDDKYSIMMRVAAAEEAMEASSEHSNIALPMKHRRKLSIGEKDDTAETRRALAMTAKKLETMRNMVVMQDEGIVYCPIPKVASAEWKRTLRWMIGIEDWQGEHTNLHSVVKNGLERLTDWGVKGTQWALGSDRYFKFVVVREPAERMVSAFLNKCVLDGYMSGRVKPAGAPNCAYLDLMPGLFPNTTEASLVSHQRLRELVEGDPEDTFFHFVSGVWESMQLLENTCQIHNHHFRPQFCFCQLQETLPAFHVIPFSNMSAEAAALADKLPAALPLLGGSDASKGSRVGVKGVGSMAHGGKGTGVDAARREEIRTFLTQRFNSPQDTEEKVTRAVERKSVFLSKRVMKVMHQMFREDYDLLADYFPKWVPTVEEHGAKNPGNAQEEKQ